MSQPKFISNSPLGEDLFEGKAQDKISNSIISLVNDESAKTKLLGLDGTWGSGKSNVIKIIQEKLKKTHHVYIHDAWGHQEDLQRRAFLEELTDDLCKNKIINANKWTKNLKDLLAKKRETITKTIPTLSIGIIIAILLAISMPIAKTIGEGVDCLLPRIIITSLPVLIVAVIWGIHSIFSKKPISIAEIFHLYKEKELENKTQMVISENEPSVREFRKWMQNLSEDLTEKKLIIVFDDMDRLPAEKVQTLWSSIHTFFSENSFEKIWVIVPFDREHIKEAFKHYDEDDENINQFINKTFSVVFRVAPLVLTDWQKFFHIKYFEAFQQTENEDYEIAENIFNMMQENITPRNIIAFINESVSIRRVVGDQILMRYIAIFILAKEKILADPVNQILNLEFLGNATNLFTGDYQIQDNIAALVYNVPLESAGQIALSREIEIALSQKVDNQNNRLNELAAYPYFIEILDQVISRGVPNFENAVIALNYLDIDKIKILNKQKLKNVWDMLAAVQYKKPITDQKVTDVTKIIFKNSSTKWLKMLVNNLVIKIQNFDHFNGSKYFDSLSDIENYIKENDLILDFQSTLKEIKVSPEIFLDYLKASKEQYKIYKVKCDNRQLNEFLITKIPNETMSLDVMSYVKREYDFKDLITRIDAAINTNQITLVNCADVFKLYKSICIAKPIKSMADSEINLFLPSLTVDSEGYYDFLAMRLARGSSFVASIADLAAIDISDQKLVIPISERIEYFEGYGPLLLQLTPNSETLLKLVLKRLTLSPIGISAMHIESVLPKFEQIRTILDVTPPEFLNRLNEWAVDAQKEINAQNVNQIVSDIKFYEAAITEKNELTEYILKQTSDFLETISVADWNIALHDEASFAFNVTYWLIEGGILKTLPENALSSFKEVLKEMANDTFVIGDDRIWKKFYESINPSYLTPTIKDIRDMFISDVRITPKLFLYFANMLLKLGSLEKRSADVARRILTPVANDDQCLSFIIQNSDAFVPIINESGDDAVDFKDIIRQKISLDTKSFDLDQFAEQINIRRAEDDQTATDVSEN